MSVHKSLVSAGKLLRHRNVLSRTERLEKLTDDGKWEEGDSIFGLPKVRNIKVRTKKKAKEVTEETAEGAEGVEGAEGAAAEGGEAAASAKETSKK